MAKNCSNALSDSDLLAENKEKTFIKEESIEAKNGLLFVLQVCLSIHSPFNLSYAFK